MNVFVLYYLKTVSVDPIRPDRRRESPARQQPPTKPQPTHLRGVPPQGVHRPGMGPRDGERLPPVAAAAASQVDDADVPVVPRERQEARRAAPAAAAVVVGGGRGGRGEAHALDDRVLQVLLFFLVCQGARRTN